MSFQAIAVTHPTGPLDPGAKKSHEGRRAS